MESDNVMTFFKKNVGEEDVIKLLLMSAGKALVSVAILIGALLSFFKLVEWYGFGFSILFVGVIFVLMIWSTMIVFGDTIRRDSTDFTKSRFAPFHPSKWKYAFDNALPVNKMIYFDSSEIRDYDNGLYYMHYLAAWSLSIVMFIIIMGIGMIGVAVYAAIVSLILSTDVNPEFLYIAVPCVSSFIIMSVLFLKLKWKKLWIDGFNWNLAAWCVCAAVIITMISFVTGVAIRRIAGFIGIEYTAILVTSYVAITAVYVYLDLKQWMAKKARESAVAATISKSSEVAT